MFLRTTSVPPIFMRSIARGCSYDNTPAETYEFNWAKSMKLHAGADILIIQEFINAIREGYLQTRTLGATSFFSHQICFLAEKE